MKTYDKPFSTLNMVKNLGRMGESLQVEVWRDGDVDINIEFIDTYDKPYITLTIENIKAILEAHEAFSG